jgi:glycosyltransferase involved in cell wall biosynthesis
MPSILFNDLITFRPRSGIGHYAALLLETLPRVAPTLSVIRVSELRGMGWIARRMSEPSGASSKSALPLGLKDRAKEFIQGALNAYLKEAIRFSNCSLYHEPDAVAPVSGVKTLLTIHDLSVLLNPDWHPAYRVAKYRRFFMRSFENASHVLAISGATKKTLIQNLKVEPHKITVVPLAGRPEFSPQLPAHIEAVQNRLGLPKNYFLFVGNQEPRKNLLGLIRAYDQLPDGVRRQFSLVLAGGAGWKSEALRAESESKSLSASLFLTGYLSDTDLVAVTAGARALVLPSFDEGFGMPALEAMACGTPVICSLAGGLAEAVGDAARVIDPSVGATITAALVELSQSDALCAELSRRGILQASKFSWEQVARGTADTYQHLLNEKS